MSSLPNILHFCCSAESWSIVSLVLLDNIILSVLGSKKNKGLEVLFGRYSCGKDFCTSNVKAKPVRSPSLSHRFPPPVVTNR